MSMVFPNIYIYMYVCMYVLGEKPRNGINHVQGKAIQRPRPLRPVWLSVLNNAAAWGQRHYARACGHAGMRCGAMRWDGACCGGGGIGIGIGIG
jgi:hypothetical protein